MCMVLIVVRDPRARGRDDRQNRIRAYAREHGINPPDAAKMDMFDRFLVRVFLGAPDDWVLKGGASILARTLHARSTKDLDLVTRADRDQALAQLRELVEVDLGDTYRFEYDPSMKKVFQRPPEGGRWTEEVRFRCFRRGVPSDSVKVDLQVLAAPLHADPGMIEPDARVHVPGQVTAKYRLYPTVHVVADKVCASLERHDTKTSTSSRGRDLVDLVTLAQTESFDAQQLATVLYAELRRRNLQPVKSFEPPMTMKESYVAQARRTPHCADYPKFEDAVALMRLFIDPLLNGSVQSGTWTGLRWTHLAN